MNKIEIVPESKKSIRTSVSLRSALEAVLREEAIVTGKSLSALINDTLTTVFKDRVQNKVMKHADLYMK
jgi:hypothetical protein